MIKNDINKAIKFIAQKIGISSNAIDDLSRTTNQQLVEVNSKIQNNTNKIQSNTTALNTKLDDNGGTVKGDLYLINNDGTIVGLGDDGNQYTMMYISKTYNSIVVGGGKRPPKIVLIRAENNGVENELALNRDSDGEYMRHLPTYKRRQGSTANVYINSAGEFARTSSSSKRFKKNIIPLKDILKKKNSKNIDPNGLYNIPVCEFEYNEGYLAHDDHKKFYGLIAEDVEQNFEPATLYDENGKVENWDDRTVLAGLLYLVQEQHKTIEQMQKEIKDLQQSNKTTKSKK